MPDAPPVTVSLVYLARLREAFGCAGESLDLPGDTPLTVDRVLAALRARGGAFARELEPGRAFRVAVNHTMARPDTAVPPGAEVAVFPPVTGG
jgi:molybdopterin synthase sulfur carrier subunit